MNENKYLDLGSELAYSLLKKEWDLSSVCRMIWLYDAAIDDFILVAQNEAASQETFGLFPEGSRLCEVAPSHLELNTFLGCTTFEWYKNSVINNVSRRAKFHYSGTRQQSLTGWWENQCTPLGDGYLAMAFRNITDEKIREEELYRRATTDPLIGIPNRLVFQSTITQKLKDPANRFAVIYIDCDQFKQVNTTYGHLVGDKLLCEVARRLQSATRKQDIVARLGGDEFGVILKDVKDRLTIIDIVDRIAKEMHPPFRIDKNTLWPSISMGVSVRDDYHESPDQIQEEADSALMEIKGREYNPADRSAWKFYDSGMHCRAVLEKQFERRLKQGFLIGNQKQIYSKFFLHYQPIYSLKNYRLLGFEALARFKDESLGLLYPKDFLEIIERKLMMSQFTEHIAAIAVSRLMAWRKIKPSIKIAINLAPHTRISEKLFSMLEQGSDGIIAEITEQRSERLFEHIVEVLSKSPVLKSADDIASESSNIHRIAKAGRGFFTFGKLDKVVRGDELLAGSIIRFATSEPFNMKIIAEGIENRGHLDMFQRLGAHYGQGFYFSEPVPEEEAEQLIVQDMLSR